MTIYCPIEVCIRPDKQYPVLSSYNEPFIVVSDIYINRSNATDSKRFLISKNFTTIPRIARVMPLPILLIIHSAFVVSLGDSYKFTNNTVISTRASYNILWFSVEHLQCNCKCTNKWFNCLSCQEHRDWPSHQFHIQFNKNWSSASITRGKQALIKIQESLALPLLMSNMNSMWYFLAHFRRQLVRPN